MNVRTIRLKSKKEELANNMKMNNINILGIVRPSYVGPKPKIAYFGLLEILILGYFGPFIKNFKIR